MYYTFKSNTVQYINDIKLKQGMIPLQIVIKLFYSKPYITVIK